MRHTSLFLSACLAAVLAPLWPQEKSCEGDAIPFPGWPSTWSAKPLYELPLEPQEETYAKSFPGRMGRFTDGESEYVFRWVTLATRKLHPATDCFRGSGYQIRPLPLQADPDGATWGCFEASNERVKMVVQEKITGSDGRSWTDVSSWYWAAVLGKTGGPWWAVTRTSAPTGN